jgi:hypothetical protein
MMRFLVLLTSLSVLLVLPEAALAGLAARDLALERTNVIVEHDYRELPRMGPAGEMGFNLTGSSTFSVSHQQLGDRYIRAGIVRDEPAIIEQGFDAFAYAFSRQRADGTFPDADQPEEYAFFVEAVAHSVLLLRETRYGERYERRLDRYVRRLTDTVPHMTGTQAWADFRYRNRFYTHSAYVMGSALTLTGALAGSNETKRYGRKAIRMGLERQSESGISPELGGYDVRYQMAGLTYAQRFPVYFPRSGLAPRVTTMISQGLRWMAPRIDTDGWIDWYGSTRACREVSGTTGKPKTPGYAFSVRGFAYWGAFVNEPSLVHEAEAVHRYADRAEELCGPKETVFSGSRASAGAQVSGSEGLDSKQASDLYE